MQRALASCIWTIRFFQAKILKFHSKIVGLKFTKLFKSLEGDLLELIAGGEFLSSANEKTDKILQSYQNAIRKQDIENAELRQEVKRLQLEISAGGGQNSAPVMENYQKCNGIMNGGFDGVSDEAKEKISFLEGELARVRAELDWTKGNQVEQAVASQTKLQQNEV